MPTASRQPEPRSAVGPAVRPGLCLGIYERGSEALFHREGMVNTTACRSVQSQTKGREGKGAGFDVVPNHLLERLIT